jgi:hypothetical protein
VHIRRRTYLGTAFAALLLAATSCGSDNGGGAATTAAPGGATTAAGGVTTAAGPATSAAGGGTTATAASSVYDVNLKDVCPDPLVIQTDWFPEPDHGYTYQLIDPSQGSIDATKGIYSGPLKNTGINLEIRAGGPFINFSPPAQQIYADPSIFAGYADTGDVIRNVGGPQALVSVFASYDIGPQILMWDPAAYPNMKTIEDVKASGATVLYFENAAYMDYLLATGKLNASQVDGSYDGSPARFVAEKKLVQQGFATSEPYTYEHDIAEWMKPVNFLLIHDTGFDIYQSALSVKPDTITKYKDCLTGLVPMLQQAQVDYMKDPKPVNTKLVEIVKALNTFWTLSDGGTADASQKMLDLKLVSDAGNSTIGDFDCDRVNGLIEKLTPVFASKGVTVPAGTTCDQVVTNEFVDTSISLGQ